ncbi:MAG: hypothetical protein HY924_14940 [Elusimicrobia bacterium]|nr:hypothetical protein [Elusimicrobiota bacterium]
MREPDFRWEEISACRSDPGLQKKHPRALAARLVRLEDLSCPSCGAGGRGLELFYYRTPERTWRLLCGRAGWIVVCPSCRRQVRFFLEAMG